VIKKREDKKRKKNDGKVQTLIIGVGTIEGGW
jgi:hypothetical protein